MKPAPFSYVRPDRLASRGGRPGARRDADKNPCRWPVAGADAQPAAGAGRPWDIRGLDALRQVEERPNSILYGALLTHAAFEDRTVPDGSNGLMPHMAAGIAFRSVRNRGTIGGALALAEPSGGLAGNRRRAGGADACLRTGRRPRHPGRGIRAGSLLHGAGRGRRADRDRNPAPAGDRTLGRLQGVGEGRRVCGIARHRAAGPSAGGGAGGRRRHGWGAAGARPGRHRRCWPAPPITICGRSPPRSLWQPIAHSVRQN